MKIAIGSDHAGFALKKKIMEHFSDRNFIDVGAHSEESCDYPDFAEAAALKVVNGEADRGIVICGTGIGISIAANKVKGVRAALCCNEFMAEMSRRHNNANMLALAARVTGEGLALRIVETWLAAEFEGGRHERRVDKMGKIENK